MFYKNTSSRSTLSSGTSFRARFFAVLFAPHTTMPTPDFLNGIPGPPASTKDWGLPSTGKEWCIPCIETEHIQPALNYGSLLPHGFSPLHQVAKTTIRPRMGLPCTPRTSLPGTTFPSEFARYSSVEQLSSPLSISVVIVCSQGKRLAM